MEVVVVVGKVRMEGGGQFGSLHKTEQWGSVLMNKVQGSFILVGEDPV